MPKDRSEKRRGPQVTGQPYIDTSILHGGRASPERERTDENKHGVPRDLAGKTPGGRDRHHCPKGGHSSDLICLKKGCMIKCAGCGIRISRYSGAKCRACAARETGRLREEKEARDAQRKMDAKFAKKGKSPKIKFFLAPYSSGIRKRTGRVGMRTLGRSSRRSRSQDYDRFSRPQLSGEESVDYEEMVEDENEWEDVQDDVDRQEENETTAKEAHRLQLLEEEATLQRKIRESLLNLLS
ncbi:uncharacterized protein LY79DRAFT_521403 [Colletotrichum navitas]|uniref:Uncharacterized protein n=1 Tax=Colletotrichum navitas TaxID=681940 RepID=A0AAD8V1U0_9PEZI|nr:uncharacterized protein LY79DRAFT_521403 [Colletotrichum navitas]KAK1580117.1 hypothetical protein LY79DRAFT_521403 [Colletotrichum navitas]